MAAYWKQKSWTKRVREGILFCFKPWSAICPFKPCMYITLIKIKTNFKIWVLVWGVHKTSVIGTVIKKQILDKLIFLSIKLEFLILKV